MDRVMVDSCEHVEASLFEPKTHPADTAEQIYGDGSTRRHGSPSPSP